MHIILEQQLTPEISEKYIVLELDHFRSSSTGQSLTAYCLVENVPLQELPLADHYRSLHAKLIENYRSANWEFCEEALQHLMGRWNGELDSFYNTIRDRMLNTADRDTWNPAIEI